MEFDFGYYLLTLGYEKSDRKSKRITAFHKDDVSLYLSLWTNDIEFCLDLDGIELGIFYIPIPTSAEAANILILELIPRTVGVLTTVKKEFDKL